MWEKRKEFKDKLGEGALAILRRLGHAKPTTIRDMYGIC
jgi:hypothetical protein